MKQIFFAFFYAVSSLFAGEINIAVAANVSYAIEPLVEMFQETNPETKVNVILGSSGKLFAQLSHGAPYDLFMSANMKYPNRLYSEHLTTDKPLIYAQGSLAMLSSKVRNFDVGLKLLTQENIKKIAVANPKTAPYGVATQEALEHANLYDVLKKKFVYGESISQTVIYATSAADIGIVAKSSFYAPQMASYKKGSQWIDIDERLYTPIDQGMVLLKNTTKHDETQAFYAFMQSPKAKEILVFFGYKVP